MAAMRWNHVVAIICVLGAIGLIAGGFEHGWGWLLFVAVLAM